MHDTYGMIATSEMHIARIALEKLDEYHKN